MVARRFLVRFHDAYFDVDYDTDHGLELFKDLVWSLTSIPPEKQKIFGSDDDRLVLDDSDLASISDRLRVASIADEVEQGEKSVDQNANLARFDEDFARMLQAEEEEEVEALMRNEKEKAEALMLQQFDQVKGKIRGEEGWISLGPWGELRRGEEYWDYKPDGPLMQITISYTNGCAINSVLFESKGYNGVVIGSSVKVGGTAGDGRWTKTFCINRSVEQLSSISLTYELNDRYPGGAVMSLCFETNRGNKYGPFGGSMGNYSLSIPIQGGVITGFHGRAGAGSWLYAIGIFVAPSVNSSGKKVGSLHSIQNPDSAPTQLKDKIRDGERCISLGPWGGNDGEDWAYKTNGPIMQISICFGQAIDSILFESKSYDGVLIGSSKKIGGSGGHATEMFCIDTSEEQLSAISLTYEYFSGKVTIISLCICTNINKYGPFGLRSGPSSLSIPIEGGVLTGFHGRAGTHLYAIGILVAPKVNGLHPIQDPNSMPTQFKVFGSGVGSKLKTPDDQKLKTPDNTIIHSAASSCGTTKEDDHHGGAPSSSSEMIRMNLDLVDSAFQKYKIHMDMQISEAREKFKELQKLGSSERDFDELGQVIAKLKFQIPLISNKDDHHGEALSPTSKMIRSDLILVDTAFAEAKESLYHMNVKINEAHDKFKDLQLLPSTERDSDKLRKADMTNYERTSQS